MFSAFILTRNSEKYLELILMQLQKACEEIIVLDSGSTDGTKAISEKHGCRFFFREFDNFKNQRTFALEKCAHDYVLMVDSDEVPDDTLAGSLKLLAANEKLFDAYRIQRDWFVLGRKIHAVYPVVSPDFPVRLFDRRISSFKNSPVVHEEPSGYKNISVLQGALHHYTFETKKEIAEKLERYTALSAQTLLKKNKNLSTMQRVLSSTAAFIKWYFVKGGWRDGVTGIILAKYAFDYTFLKYGKARAAVRSGSR